MTPRHVRHGGWVAVAAGLIIAALSASGTVIRAMPPSADRARCDPSGVRTLPVPPDRLAGLPRTHTQHTCPGPIRASDAARRSGAHRARPIRHDVYGDCAPQTSDGGCQPPLQLATSRDYRLTLRALVSASEAGLAPPLTQRLIDGRRVGSRAGGTQLVIDLGRETVSIFADTRARARAALRAIVPKNQR